MNGKDSQIVLSSEHVIRLLNRIWVVDGVLQPAAFVLNAGEAYLSVNRPAIESYVSDVADFLSKHVAYTVRGNQHSYYCANLSVGDIRNIGCQIGDERLTVDVDVEPRASHYQSHAGIFTRVDGVNVKADKPVTLGTKKYGVSSEPILMKLRFALLRLSHVELCTVE